jgi:hypothetical protein
VLAETSHQPENNLNENCSKEIQDPCGYRAAGTIGLLLSLATPDSAHAQGLGNLSLLLDGFQQSRRSGGSGTEVTVERGAMLYKGEFIGRQTSSSTAHTSSGRFACYSAVDPAFAQTQTFVCYAPQNSAN